MFLIDLACDDENFLLLLVLLLLIIAHGSLVMIVVVTCDCHINHSRGNNNENQDNMLTGAIPPSLVSLTALQYLYLSVRTLAPIITYEEYVSSCAYLLAYLLVLNFSLSPSCWFDS